MPQKSNYPNSENVSNRRSRLFQLLFFAGTAAILIGTNLSKKSGVSCFNHNQVDLFFSATRPLTSHISLSLQSLYVLENLSFLDIDVRGTKWKIAAFEICSVGDLLAELFIDGEKKYPFPLIILIRDSVGAEYLIVCNEEKQIFLSSLKHLIEDCKIAKATISSPKDKKEPVSLCISIN